MTRTTNKVAFFYAVDQVSYKKMTSLETILPTIGYAGITAIIFAESGLFFGFFLPGDSLLFTAGFLASQGFFDIVPLSILCFVAAVAGDSVGYYFGKKVGPRLFTRKDSLLFHKEHISKAQHFYEKHGKKTIVLARFLPLVRTFAPIVAGIGSMPYGTFFAYNVFGGLIWAVGLTWAGYFLGKSIPDVDAYLLPIVLFIVFISVAPTAWHILKDPAQRQSIIDLFKKYSGQLQKTNDTPDEMQ
ncbi:MAG: Inner membrane protein YqjA [Microgenomates bacterium OLB22]|nr:MAG: Inner membrane protein YqjA [Microgenomates bacterium OLB22]